MASRLAQRTFAGGEVDASLRFASDYQPLRNGALKLTNVMVRPNGSVTRIPATEFVAKAASLDIQLMAFRPAQAGYCVEIGPDYMRVRSGEHDPDDPTFVEVVGTGYGAGDLAALQVTQGGDVAFIFSGLPIQELRRTSIDPLEFELHAFETEGPFRDPNLDHDITVTSSAQAGATVTLTSSHAIWSRDEVGSQFRVDEADLSDVPAWRAGVDLATGAFVRYDGNTYRVWTGGTTSGNPPAHLEGDWQDGPDGVVFTYQHSGFGIVRIDAVAGDGRSATCHVLRRLPASIRDGSYRWRRAAWSGREGYPRTGAFFSASMWAAATDGQPATIWKSGTEAFDQWTLGTEDTDPVSRALRDGQTGEIYWLTPSYQALLAGTDGPEWEIGASERGDTVRPTNLRTAPTTQIGAAPLPGIAITGEFLVLDAQRTALRAPRYEFASNDFVAPDLTLAAPHILEPGVVQMAYQRRPWPILWALREDGTLAGLTYDRQQSVIAWWRMEHPDPVRSIAVVPIDHGRREALHLAVERVVAGTTEIHIERMAQPRKADMRAGLDVAHVAGGRFYDLDAKTNTFDGLDHLEGRHVVARIDGYLHGAVPVVDGRVTLSFSGSTGWIGLPLPSRVETPPFDHGAPDSYMPGRVKELQDIYVLLAEAQGVAVAIDGREATDVFLTGAAPLGQAQPPKTGAFRASIPKGGLSQTRPEGRTIITNETAGPMSVLGVQVEYGV